ncbi:MAG: hypothetical protein EP306_00730 [Burkholderiales bacterium]|nr:MAG: hypothetical protein EP306_00730 [Burkholderiales bacterium]
MKSVTRKLTDSVRAARSDAAGVGARVAPAPRSRPKSPPSVRGGNPVAQGTGHAEASAPRPSAGDLFPQRVWPD